MTDFQDLFSSHAECYARARPRYPAALFAYLAGLVPEHRRAWDCGTGNGQAAISLVEHFDRVVATDASAAQIEQAIRHQRISYVVATAEDAQLDPSSVDLVTVGTALHWFRLDPFYANVRRVAKPGCVIAAWCYSLASVDPRVDAVVDRLYREITGPYWPADRRWVDERYETIPFPFDEIRPTPAFECREERSLPEYVGYLTSWSAAQRFKQEKGHWPVEEVFDELATAWGPPDRRRTLTWPIHLRVGQVRKLKVPRHLSPDLRSICDLEVSLGNEVATIAEPAGTECPLAVAFRDPLHFDEASRRLALPATINRWECRDPHYAVEAGYQCTKTRHCVSGPIP